MRRFNHSSDIAVFGGLEQKIGSEREHLLDFFNAHHDIDSVEILDPDTELQLEAIRGDAEMIAYILGEDSQPSPASKAAHRGIAFAHMTLDKLDCKPKLISLHEYWETSIGLPHSAIEERLISDIQSYIYQHEVINDILSYYMSDLAQPNGFEHVVEAGAVLTFRQTEVHAAIDTFMPRLQRQLDLL